MAQFGEYATLDTAAKQAGLTYSQLWRRVRRGDIPSIRVGRSILVRIKDARYVRLTTR